MLGQTPSQTVGPFYAYGLIFPGQNTLTADDPDGQRIRIHGQVFDGDGIPINDAMIEIWQADSQGIFNHPDDPRHEEADKNFPGFGRSDTGNEKLTYWFKTIKPGCVLWEGDQTQAPHISVRVFARGMLIHALTRLYFSDEAANAADPVLNSIEEADRRQTLIAVREDSDDLPTYRFDIRLQGDGETVFFNP
jgi:protocatechuate 3,4-dioxygenase alpha subunit